MRQIERQVSHIAGYAAEARGDLYCGVSEVRTAKSADGTVIHFDVRGEGETVVLLHGLACNRQMWDGVAQLLEDAGRRVLVVDLRGHGDSTVANATFDTKRFVEDVRAVLEEADATKCTLVGHSAGGIQALAFAASVSREDEYRPVAVITFGTSLTLNRVRERFVLRFSATRLFYGLLKLPVVGRLVVRAGAFGRRPSADAITATLGWARSCPPTTKRGWVNAVTKRSFLDCADAPTRIRLGSGDRDTAFSSTRLRASLTGSAAEVFAVPGAGHMAPLEQPAAVAAWILSA